MTKPIINVENISKLYKIGSSKEPYLSFRDEIVKWISPAARRAKAARGDFWALKDVSFNVKQGESVGIIGRNGAGKSTLLKILSQITPPTEGKITMRGRVASLLEVGTGFHPELTGRENIFLNGAILGMTRREVKGKFDKIVAFAEVEKFLDTPVKRYSSGMYVRLAFAVAAHLEPEILVVDEVLAVGDAAFQKKCLGKMEDVAKEGRTVLFVSHNMPAVQQLCQSGFVLENGMTVESGTIDKVVKFYMEQFNAESNVVLADRDDREGSGKVRLVGVFFEQDGRSVSVVQTGESCCICFRFVAMQEQANVSIAFTVRDERSQFLFRPSTEDTGNDFSVLPKQGIFRCNIKRLPLIPGRYRITSIVTTNGEIADYIEGVAFMLVEAGNFFSTGRLNTHSPVLLDHTWDLLCGTTEEGHRSGKIETETS